MTWRWHCGVFSVSLCSQKCSATWGSAAERSCWPPRQSHASNVLRFKKKERRSLQVSWSMTICSSNQTKRSLWALNSLDLWYGTNWISEAILLHECNDRFLPSLLYHYFQYCVASAALWSMEEIVTRESGISSSGESANYVAGELPCGERRYVSGQMCSAGADSSAVWVCRTVWPLIGATTFRILPLRGRQSQAAIITSSHQCLKTM